MPSALIMPNVISNVIGIASAISSAARHSQKPTNETSTTSSNRLVQARHEQMNVLAHLLGLIARVFDDEILGQPGKTSARFALTAFANVWIF